MKKTGKTQKLNGGCLCGQIRYSLKTLHQDGYYCHCRMCQLAFGNTHASFLNAQKKNITWLKKKPKVYRSSKFARREFCGKCGTPLTFAYDGSDYFDISVGSFDHPEKIRPTSHFAVEACVKNWMPKDRLKKTTLDSDPKLLDKWKKYYGAREPGIRTIRNSKIR